MYWPCHHLPRRGQRADASHDAPLAGPELLDTRKDMVLGFLYAHLPESLVSTDASLSCAAADSPGDGVDRINTLPDDLLRSVVSRLPAIDSACTTTLSSRWRRLWLSAPLVLVDTNLLPAGGSEGWPPRASAALRAMTDAVSRALEAHPGPFPFIGLTCSFMDDADRGVLARCVQLLATKGVDVLVFVNRPWPLRGLRLPQPPARLYIGALVFPDTATLPRGSSFHNLRERVLGCVLVEDKDLDFMLTVSPVLESLRIVGSLTQLHARLASHSLQCAQFCLSILEEVALVDTPCLERLFIWKSWSQRRSRRNLSTRVKIGHAPQLRLLGYLDLGVHVLEIGNTIIKAGTKTSPSIQVLALHLHFDVGNEVKMLRSFLRCFPNVEMLSVESERARKSTGSLNLKFRQETGPIECVQSYLKTMVFREFHWEKSEFAFLMFIRRECTGAGEDVYCDERCFRLHCVYEGRGACQDESSTLCVKVGLNLYHVHVGHFIVPCQIWYVRYMHRLYQTWCQSVVTDSDSVSSPYRTLFLRTIYVPSSL